MPNTFIDFQKSGLKEIENIQQELAQAGYKRSVNNLLAVYMKVCFYLSLFNLIEQKLPELQSILQSKRP